MAWYNPFSWGEKAQDNVLDKKDGLIAQVGNWIGNMNLTEEEAIELNQKMAGDVREFAKATLSENTERSVARREIAILWIKAELGLILMSCIAAPWDMDLARFYMEIATAGVMSGGTISVLVFFFGSHGWAKIKSTKKAD